LPLLAGYGRATQIILTGDPFNAEVAEKYGIVNWVVEDNENLLDSARIVLKRILQNSPAAIRMALPCIYGAHKEDPGKFESRSFAKCALTNDFQEGTRAFLEKRTPQFKGH
jgi:enoyl-CoA hydratase